MISLNTTFIVHIPYFLKRNFNFFKIGRNETYFDDEKTKQILDLYAEHCYLPANATLLNIIKNNKKDFKINFMIDQLVLDLLQKYRQDVLESFQNLVATGNVELLSGTGTHTLASLYSKTEFSTQVKNYQKLLSDLFNYKPKVFLNTDMIYSNDICNLLEPLKFNAILTEGADFVLGWRSVNFVYQPKHQIKMRLLFRNAFLSDIISFNFSNSHWHGYPITAEKYTQMILEKQSNLPNIKNQVINIAFDYETFGYYQPLHSGILLFLVALPRTVLATKKIIFNSASDVIKNQQPVAGIDVDHPISWVGVEKDLSAWQGNDLQNSCLESLYNLENSILKTKDQELIKTWRILQCADYFQNMDTRWTNVGYKPHKINNFDTVEEAYIVYNNIINDLSIRIHS